MSSSRNWTEKEKLFLKSNWGYKSVPSIAKTLNRAENGIIIKAKRMKLGSPYTSGEFLNASQIAKLLLVDTHTITDYWIEKCKLKASHKAMRKTFKMWLVSFDNLVEWLKNNTDKWDSRKLELYALGQEYDWLIIKRKDDEKHPKRRFCKWTNWEDMKAIQLYKKGYSYKEIGETMERPTDGVERRLSRLDVWGTGEYTGDKYERKVC